MTTADRQPLDYPFALPTADEPPPEWARLRQECPVAAIRLASGDEALLLTRYEDVRQVLGDPRFTRSLSADDAARVTANESGGIFGSASAIDASTDAHQQWRRLVGKAFTAKRMSQMRPAIEAMAARLLDEMCARGAPADLVASFAFPLPVWVICDLLGVPDSDRDRFSYWSDTMLSLDRYEQTEIDSAQQEFGEYFAAHIATRRAEPGDDLLSELIAVTDAADGRLPEELLMLTGQGLLVAGHETTANMISKMVVLLLSERSRWTAVVEDPSLVRTAAEEALRFDANAGFGLPRYLTEEIEVGGRTMPRGTTIVTSLASANRDEQVFVDADDMDLRRAPNPHLAFGVGPHSCLGQALARTELQAVLSVLVRRLPGLDLAVPVEELPLRKGLLVGGLERLPVRW
ncbi:cytochrome P450 [Actinoalloteichus hoggarensis]|uniref:Cytochrome P450 107B1 n=1 Tax=Actinoalloteichus hoggarensis TaxID=1470176 RepID=A0A221W4N3_9PSEU|nr:cytochrome P450 [Actinoalloteichus hoggarensis]ASO20850.1 Cytochrome P450 107B1 [Actinoalloteichus hoggarensis]MBB5920781.1 cytochrome P450 [Actinoalloteichus hoggarensis]